MVPAGDNSSHPLPPDWTPAAALKVTLTGAVTERFWGRGLSPFSTAPNVRALGLTASALWPPSAIAEGARTEIIKRAYRQRIRHCVIAATPSFQSELGPQTHRSRLDAGNCIAGTRKVVFARWRYGTLLQKRFNRNSGGDTNEIKKLEILLMVNRSKWLSRTWVSELRI
jgi:hypothetical protein